ncbi:hypothetical protein TNIN_258051 [Trichonephila inaurata madagascariensis]|uniref:Uncharacterized protein n=1 Tax=Trichonephila inaurata madagascariensis TaxID=2747483 RepID=A0A8X6I7I8_9ARAC|nr:hypothetical protein TNIN_258051 [Trichonephila inaurata madagascariensis]
MGIFDKFSCIIHLVRTDQSKRFFALSLSRPVAGEVGITFHVMIIEMRNQSRSRGDFDGSLGCGNIMFMIISPKETYLRLDESARFLETPSGA